MSSAMTAPRRNPTARGYVSCRGDSSCPTADADVNYRSGTDHVTAPHDPPALLAAIAASLNDAERAGLLINGLEHGTVQTRAGCVVPFGTAELGHRWVVRPRVPRIPEGGGR